MNNSYCLASGIIAIPCFCRRRAVCLLKKTAEIRIARKPDLLADCLIVFLAGHYHFVRVFHPHTVDILPRRHAEVFFGQAAKLRVAEIRQSEKGAHTLRGVRQMVHLGKDRRK